MPAKGSYLDLVGRMFGRLRVVAHAGNPKGRTLWECVCLCGETGVIAEGSRIQSGKTASCGCLARESAIDNGRKSKGPISHGDTKGGVWTPEYKAWCAMLARCKPTMKPETRAIYYDRGIRVCDRWAKNYPNFLEDMGRKPTPGHTLDRIDNNRGYEPGNCRWATWRTQRLNQRRSA